MVEMHDYRLKPIHDGLHEVSIQLNLLSKRIRALAEQLHIADGSQKTITEGYDE